MIESINAVPEPAATYCRRWAGTRPEEIAEKMDLPIDKVRKALDYQRTCISRCPTGEDEDSSMGDLIETVN